MIKRLFVLLLIPISVLAQPAGQTNPAQEHTSATSYHSARLTNGSAFYACTTPSDTQPVSGTLTCNLGTLNGVSTAAKQDTIIGHVDGIEGLLTTIDGDTDAMRTALEIIDDWDESDRAKVNPIVGQAGVAANAGAVGANTQQVVMGYNTAWVPLAATYASAQTDTAIVSASAGQIICVKNLDALISKATSVNVAVTIGFGAANTPSTTGVILKHGGFVAGSGEAKFFGSDGICSQSAGDDLRITSDAATDGALDVTVVYKTF